MAQLTRQREEKLARFREQKEMEKKLDELEKAVSREHVDDEVKVIMSFLSHNHDQIIYECCFH